MDESLRAALLATAWLVGWWLCGRVRTLPTARPNIDPDSLASMSVVVPARDEERVLPVVLDALATQRVPPREVVVVDDGSDDRTAAIAVAHGARVLRAGELREGWTGKSAALWQGACDITSDAIVFLDADVEPTSELIASLGAAHVAHGGLVSVQPYHRMRHWWERASAFFNLVAVMGVGLGSPRWPGRRSIVAAFGPVVVCRRDRFMVHGAEPRVRSAVVEDVALAQAFAGAGEPVSVYAGRGVVSFRMYDRPARLLEGWTKNFATGARAVPPARLALIVVWITACLVSGAWLLSGATAAVVVFVAFAVQCFVQLRQLGRFGVLSALLYPVLALVFVVGFAVSLALLVRGEVPWKGRRIRVRAGRAH